MSLVKDAIVAELTERMKKSVEWKDELDAAKTSTKRQYYKKKLAKNNAVVADLMLSLDRVAGDEPTDPGSYEIDYGSTSE